MTRLGPATLPLLPDDVTVPAYERDAITTGIVHLGLGAFTRAHMANYVDDVLADAPEWGIVGVSLRRPDTRDALVPQGGLYTLSVNDAAGAKLRVIGAVRDVLVASEDIEKLIDLMAAEQTRIVSLTVTEKGYCHDPATGELDEDNADIKHDLENPDTPRSAPGFIVAALKRRKAEDRKPFTVMSCDNLPANGETAQKIVVRLAELSDPELAVWIREKGAFPSTMVDRIVPATTDEDRERVRERLSQDDAWPVMAEPFTQWVIEDRFADGRPPFEKAGAQMVVDVAPFEMMKLRMLNGSHSSLAYLGYLMGHQTVSEAVADPLIARFLRAMMREEIMPTLEVPGIDLDVYAGALISRFRNPALRHRTWQIAMDGSQKMPQRLLGTIRDRLEKGEPFERLALGVAAWMRYVTGWDEEGNAIDVRDPMAERLREIADMSGRDGVGLARRLIALPEIFGSDLQQNKLFVNYVGRHLAALFEHGAEKTLKRLLDGA